MSTGYQIKDQSALYFLTFQVVDWIDVFTRQNYQDLVIESLDFCQKNKGLQVFAYVVMSNHLHLIVNSPMGELSDTIRDFKRFTSNNILAAIKNNVESRREWMLERFENHAQRHKRNTHYQLWTHSNHAEVLYSNPFIEQKLIYIHNNPVKAGIVKNPEDYLYSSARNYAGLDNLMDVVLLAVRWKTY